MAIADTRQIRERIVRINIRMPPALHGSDRDAVGTNSTQVVDRLALQRELSRVVTGEVRFGDGDRGMSASDAGNYRMVPIGVVLPRTADDVVRATAVCRRSEVPIFARGGGTGFPGQTVNDGLLFDFSNA